MIFLASTPAPSNDGGAPDPDLVTPGTIGFLATLAVVIVTIFIIRDALRRVRRIRARSGTTDAYPIPLRRNVVPNQSKLSGPDEPEQTEAPADDDPAGEEPAPSEPEDTETSQEDSDKQS